MQISIVTVFELNPEALLPVGDADSRELRVFKSLLNRFLDLPPDEEARLAQWNSSHADPSSPLTTHSEHGGGGVSPSAESWSVPGDVTWPRPEEEGVLPHSDFRNCRYRASEDDHMVAFDVEVVVVKGGRSAVMKWFHFYH
jgi:hypothetical protein